jgi:hypothetical protein
MPKIHTALLLLVAAIAAMLPAAGTAWASVAAPAHGRAWELITPPDPNGAPVNSVYGIAPDGDRLAYNTVGPLPGAQAGSLQSPSMATRTQLGWASVPIATPYSVPQLSFSSPLLAGASEDMSRSIWTSPFPLTPDGPSSPAVGLYSRDGIGAAPALLASVAASFEFSGGSSDMRRLFFQSGTALLPEDVKTSGRQVYESTDAGLRLAGVDSAGVPLSTCGAAVGSDSYPPNPISRDGRRVFVTSPDATCGTARKRIYLREDGATTTEISASRCTRVAPACNAAADVRFMGATPSGSVAFVATAQQLTDDDVDAGQDLYRYDVAGGVLSRVSVGPVGVSANVTTTAAYPSDDGSRVYFIANGQLVPGKGVANGANVYVADGEGLRFVATIVASDSWRTPALLASRREDVQLTPDGARLVFMTTAPLTAADTDTRKDVYLYDAEDETLTRVSGLPGSGNGVFDADIAQGATSQPTAGYPLRSLSTDGRHVFLKTDESLLSDDGNTTTDVYEWEDGDLGLVSSGGASKVVRYHTASADGSSVFFSTDESLTAGDDDGGYLDLYVARKGGGFPPPAEPAPDGCGDGCPPAPIVRLYRPVPASVDFVERATAARLKALPVSPAARRRMAASGWLRLRIRTGAPGRIAATARARVGRRRAIVARGAVRAAHAGTVPLRLRLSPAARGRLGDGHALSIRVALRRSAPDRSAAFSLVLEPPR